MRGTRVFARRIIRRRRFIPAYAGNTHTAFRLFRSGAVHPRVCGEHTVADAGLQGITGSSPRMRGTLKALLQALLVERFIPAYAGNTASDALFLLASTVHPRVCGEHERRLCGYLTTVGSSPRMRGTRPFFYSVRRRRRFIPAYAGNTRSCGPLHSRFPVHPRVCGEHMFVHASSALRRGSSPRMRGTLLSAHDGTEADRFIPAYAGNTVKMKRPGAGATVHPRVCGEHDVHALFRQHCLGSSPRMRGTLAVEILCLAAHRFIPAYAGNTSPPRFSRRRRSVHPRVCGEHPAKIARQLARPGSSPRMRGTLVSSVTKFAV